MSARAILRRSAKVFAAIALADAVLTVAVYLVYGWLAAYFAYSYSSIVEAALLLIGGGFYDWSEAEWGIGFKRLTGNRDAKYSKEAHRVADRKGMALIAAGAMVFLLALVVDLLIPAH